jgi:hypothetical protein
MARIRTIKPEFFTSEDIVSLSPLARLLYVALWCEADREGRMNWKPRTWKLRYLPADNCDVEALCKEITDAGLVVLYGDGYAHIPCFSRHQHINPRETASSIPDPDASKKKTTRAPRVTDASSRDSDAQGGREGKGKEGVTGVDVDPFDAFWQSWPKNERKQDKAKCAEHWTRNSLDEESDAILADIATKRQTTKWQGGYIEAPLVYLRGKRWEDGVAPDGGRLSVVTDVFAGAK